MMSIEEQIEIIGKGADGIINVDDLKKNWRDLKR